MFILLIYSINETNKLKHEKIQKALFSQYMSSLNEINIEMQKFRHDYKNILITMERYIDNKDLDGLKKYFKEKIINTEKNTLLKNSLIHDLGNLELMELKGLLLTKLLTAVEKKIDIQIEIPEKIDSIYMDIIDLSRMIGILIDNAIEASIECENPFINLAIMKTNDNSVLMIIENNFTNTLDIHQLYKNHYSTKKGNRGYGLNNVKDILNNYPNVLMNTSIEENIFIQEIEIR
ncbi:GHKL domain-containing protein [Ureibacillus sp. FSL K6-0786]|uniref:GHKL domain-containing protein n=1 Tax=Ureibacillus sp. FSL K6-0786 TaxID=2954607 RepID=UPI0030D9466D